MCLGTPKCRGKGNYIQMKTEDRISPLNDSDQNHSLSGWLQNDDFPIPTVTAYPVWHCGKQECFNLNFIYLFMFIFMFN